jgi:hypothetical protein
LNVIFILLAKSPVALSPWIIAATNSAITNALITVFRVEANAFKPANKGFKAFANPFLPPGVIANSAALFLEASAALVKPSENLLKPGMDLVISSKAENAFTEKFLLIFLEVSSISFRSPIKFSG